MPTTRDNAVIAGAEMIAVQAKDVGMKCGMHATIAAPQVLECALAIAWCDVAMWKGANDTDERFEATVQLMASRIRDNMIRQRILRRGHKPT